jgi:hypothetical protein
MAVPIAFAPMSASDPCPPCERCVIRPKTVVCGSSAVSIFVLSYAVWLDPPDAFSGIGWMYC